MTIVVNELSLQSFSAVEQDFSEQKMRAGGMETIAREIVETPGGPAQLVAARVRQPGGTVRKWALLTRTDDMTAIVLVSMPETATSVYPDAVIRAALASTFIRPKLASDEMLAVLPFRLADLGGFRVLRTEWLNTAVLTLGPKDTSLPIEQPYFLVARRTSELPPAAAREDTARRMLTVYLNRVDLRIVTAEQARIGGEPGHEIIAEMDDTRTSDPLMVVQWVQFGPRGLVQMYGIARKDQWAEALPRMRTLRDGFALK